MGLLGQRIAWDRRDGGRVVNPVGGRTLGSTDFGFRWGPMLVERLAHIDGRGYVLQVQTGHRKMQYGPTARCSAPYGDHWGVVPYDEDA